MKFSCTTVMLVVGTALSLSGCLSKPGLTLEKRGVPGVFQDSFTAGEVPVVVVDGIKQAKEQLRIISLPDGAVIRRFPMGGRTRRDAPDDPIFSTTTIPQRGLSSGNYVAELWADDRLISSVKFSVTGAGPNRAISFPADSRLVETYLSNYVRHCPSIVDRVGVVLSATAREAHGTTSFEPDTPVASGDCSFDISGQNGSGRFTVYWEQQESQPMRAVRIEVANGATLALP